jgi:hypothetical protein
LVQALDQTGILQGLIIGDETSKAAIERAKAYFLVFATVSSCLTFSLGPRLMDFEHAFEADPKEQGEHVNNGDGIPTEETGLLSSYEQNPRGSVSFYPSIRPRGSTSIQASVQNSRQQSYAAIFDRRPSVIPKRKWSELHPRLQWWLLLFFDFLNAPLLGAVAGAFVGLIPVLHRAFFFDTEDGGIFTAWLTASFRTIGSLFVPLPVLVAGVSLYAAYIKDKNEESGESQSESVAESTWATTTFVLVVRFIVWPVFSIGLVYLLITKTTILGSDPMLWFALMLMPTGPSAMKLITMVEVSDASEEDEHKIAKLLTVSICRAPIFKASLKLLGRYPT